MNITIPSINTILPETHPNNQGILLFSKEMLKEFTENKPLMKLLKEVFTSIAYCDTFNPLIIEVLGTSPHFRKINPDEDIPKYNMLLFYDENGLSFDKMQEMK